MSWDKFFVIIITSTTVGIVMPAGKSAGLLWTFLTGLHLYLPIRLFEIRLHRFVALEEIKHSCLDVRFAAFLLAGLFLLLRPFFEVVFLPWVFVVVSSKFLRGLMD